MSKPAPEIRIGVYGPDPVIPNERHGSGLWPAGYAAALTFAGGVPVSLGETLSDKHWNEVLDGLHGVLLVGGDGDQQRRTADGERLCEWCQEHGLPILGIDHGLHVLNTTYGGTLFLDLPREQPEALQHRHPPEKGLRHAIAVTPETRLAQIYGEGEVVVNSEHRRAVNRAARGFRASALALDGIIEAIESTSDDWFALGVQWHPASSTASGLDIQVFRGLIDACARRLAAPSELKLAAGGHRTQRSPRAGGPWASGRRSGPDRDALPSRPLVGNRRGKRVSPSSR
jgi:putative glutamine amidotransferase